MALLFHLLFAFGSIGLSTYVVLRPSAKNLATSYALVFGTLMSGFYLVFTIPTSMIEVCTVGLFYLGFVSFALVSARNQLKRASIFSQ